MATQRSSTARASTGRSAMQHPAMLLVRRAFFRWQFIAAVALPLWVLVGWALWGASHSLIGIALVAPLLFIVQLGLAGVLSLRASVRRERALSWPDAAALTVFAVAVIGVGTFSPASSWFWVLAIVAGIGTFWLGLTEWFVEVRERVRATLAGLGAAQPGRVSRPPIDAGEYIVLPHTPPR